MDRMLAFFAFGLILVAGIMVFAGPVLCADPKDEKVDPDPKGLGQALLEACKNCNNTLVHAIILAQPNLDFQDKFGDTALHKAAGYCSGASVGIKIVKALLDAGADPSQKNQKDETPLSIAVKLGEEDMAQVILAHLKQAEKKKE